MKQIDIFGGESEVLPPKKEGGRKKRLTMQEMYGVKEGKKCKECVHLCYKQYSRVYYKCELWHISCGASTDIRLRNVACGKFESEVKQ